jgi:serine/threonine-protein kinase RsbW
MTKLTGSGGGTDVATSETVRLTIPAAHEFVRIARLTVSGVASRLGFDVDEIEDLRVAVDELSSILVDASGDGPLELTFSPGDGGVEIEGRAHVGDSFEPVIDDLTRQILGVVVDQYGVEADEGEARFRCVKRLTN